MALRSLPGKLKGFLRARAAASPPAANAASPPAAAWVRSQPFSVSQKESIKLIDAEASLQVSRELQRFFDEQKRYDRRLHIFVAAFLVSDIAFVVWCHYHVEEIERYLVAKGMEKHNAMDNAKKGNKKS